MLSKILASIFFGSAAAMDLDNLDIETLMKSMGGMEDMTDQEKQEMQLAMTNMQGFSQQIQQMMNDPKMQQMQQQMMEDMGKQMGEMEDEMKKVLPEMDALLQPGSGQTMKSIATKLQQLAVKNCEEREGADGKCDAIGQPFDLLMEAIPSEVADKPLEDEVMKAVKEQVDQIPEQLHEMAEDLKTGSERIEEVAGDAETDLNQEDAVKYAEERKALNEQRDADFQATRPVGSVDPSN